ncbi:hypothetical protein CS022_13265 [Veronia nyctiphanis]|uniref:Dystroglycan-type cadherin-like domain-containing protein n=1 Tax=Veronia nyctiphanis TaxID=1278244 RepID=A0A4Q0YPE0_9GAMM|nr:hypothetical protein [Veronia nyctiphanis]RXJ72822.1 hypothetical protein CS022_13265 [Veronia nyctiphanis]
MGTVEFHFTANGEEIDLAPGATADVTIPIYTATYPDGSNINIGDSVPLWSLNEDTGIWTQEGNGTVIASSDSPTALAFEATVSHFSWWNCDVSINAGQVTVTVVSDKEGTATIYGETQTDIGWRPSQVGTVISVNSSTNPLFVPSNAETCLRVTANFDDGTSANSDTQCVTPAPSESLARTFTVGIDTGEPLNVVPLPKTGDDLVEVVGLYLNSLITPIQLLPVSTESSVTYSISSGSLPPGISLNAINATQAEIVGSTTTSGSFSAIILAIDDEGASDEIIVSFDVSNAVAPPDLPAASQKIEGTENVVVDLNTFNQGGAVAAWMISDELPDWLSFNNSTGILTMIEEPDTVCKSFTSPIMATNSSGNANSLLTVGIFQGGTYVQIGGDGLPCVDNVDQGPLF